MVRNRRCPLPFGPTFSKLTQLTLANTSITFVKHLMDFICAFPMRLRLEIWSPQFDSMEGRATPSQSSTKIQFIGIHSFPHVYLGMFLNWIQHQDSAPERKTLSITLDESGPSGSLPLLGPFLRWLGPRLVHLHLRIYTDVHNHG